MENFKNPIIEKKESKVRNLNLENLKRSIESKKSDLRDIQKSEGNKSLYYSQFNSKKERGKIRRELFNIVNDTIAKDRDIEVRKNSILKFYDYCEKYLIGGKNLNFAKVQKSDISNVRNESKEKDLMLFLKIVNDCSK
jgi:hypothetical protein